MKNHKLGLAVLMAGLIVVIPTGIDDLLVNVPIGIAISKIFNVSPAISIPATYLLGLPLVIAGFFMVTKRQWKKTTGKVTSRFDV